MGFDRFRFQHGDVKDGVALLRVSGNSSAKG
jgi:hypothetical protein